MRGMKIFAAVAFVMIFAGGAFAYQGCGAQCGTGMGQNRMQAVNASPELKAKNDEIRKIADELRAEMNKKTPDAAKAKELHSKLVKMRGEFAEERFELCLKNPGMRQGKMERSFTPAEKEKRDEIAKLHKEMRDEFAKQSPNKVLLNELHKKIQLRRNELCDMRFAEMLKNPENYKNAPCFDGRGHGGKCGMFN